MDSTPSARPLRIASMCVLLVVTLIRCASAMGHTNSGLSDAQRNQIVAGMEQNQDYLTAGPCDGGLGLLPSSSTTTVETTNSTTSTTVAPKVTADTVDPGARFAAYYHAYWACDPAACDYIDPTAVAEIESIGKYPCEDILPMFVAKRMDQMGMTQASRDIADQMIVTVEPVESVDGLTVEIPRESVTLGGGTGDPVPLAPSDDPELNSFTMVLVGDQWMIKDWAL